MRTKTGKYIAQVYLPAAYVRAKNDLKRWLQIKTAGRRRFRGPVAVTLVFGIECPASSHRKSRPAPARWRDKKPDADNLAKTIMDAATGVLWTDDAQAALALTAKLTLPQGWTPGVLIIVQSLQTADGAAELERYTGMYARALQREEEPS